jgi:hypothetical protein
MIRFRTDTELEIVETFDETTEQAETVLEKFEQDDRADGDIFDETEDTADIQFGDGSVAFNVSKDLFEII